MIKSGMLYNNSEGCLDVAFKTAVHHGDFAMAWLLSTKKGKGLLELLSGEEIVDVFKSACANEAVANSIAPTPGHARQINLVVFDAKTGKTLQAISLQCPV